MTDTDWTVRPEDTCQDCLAESDDNLAAYLAAVVRNHPHVTTPASTPTRSGCYVDNEET